MRPNRPSTPNLSRLDQIVAASHKQAAERERGYREQALKLYPWVCGRCGREFTRTNLSELTVHHRNHNHDDNPADGSNWELLCLYCHDNEHQRQLEAVTAPTSAKGEAIASATHNPFAALQGLLKK
ncbi:MAG: YajD family HNH nuclease [Lysobacterales bacterium]